MKMIVITVPLAEDIAEALDDLAEAKGCSRAELTAEAVARFVLEERQALDRIVQARLRQLDTEVDGPTQEQRSFDRA
jgi:predicted transcriptional regulator